MNQKGISLIAAMAVTALIGIAVYAMVLLFMQQSRFTSRMDRKARGDEILARTASAFQQMDFDALIQICTQKNAFASNLIGPCIVGKALNPALTPPADPKDSSLEVLRSLAGDIPTPSTCISQLQCTCVELSHCDLRVGSRILDVGLRGYWQDPVKPEETQSKYMVVRRTRW